MDVDHVATVRRFHRLVTQRAGALEDRFLGRDRPLGESRLLFEIGREGATLLALRGRLGLDSGYLSRLAASLVKRGLAELEPAERDERIRRARLTDAGLAELDEIDRRSDELAAGILRPLNSAQRERLVAAMAEVHRLLAYAGVAIDVVDPAGPEARWCLERYFEELGRRFEAGFDPARSVVVDHSDLVPPRGVFLVATLDGRSIACGAVKKTSAEVGYIKRMWVDGSLRGLGLGRRLLAALEDAARDLGCSVAQLETNRSLTEAIRMYRTTGYVEVEPFNDEPYAHHWFEKRLGS